MISRETRDTRLDRAIAPLVRAHPGMSGVCALPDGRDAFAARVLLADAAERSLDARYYIWRDDLSGGLLFDAFRRAAGRGVRVRLLLDDIGTAGLDPLLAALDARPNIEVRLFNPFKNRRWRLLGFLTDFARLNRRMHNKSFSADDRATIIGGRNVGDEYFDARQGGSFADLDVLAVGPVVAEVARRPPTIDIRPHSRAFAETAMWGVTRAQGAATASTGRSGCIGSPTKTNVTSFGPPYRGSLVRPRRKGTDRTSSPRSQAVGDVIAS